MKILVTGGAGFIGSHVVDACLEAGHSIVVLDDLSTGKRKNVNPDANLRIADLRDEAAVEKLFRDERPETICHLAAKANVRESLTKPMLYADVNVIGTLVLLEMARRHGARKIIYASSGGAVYGEPEYLPVDENHPVRPLDPYGASKHHVEHYLDIYRSLHNLDYTTLRFGNVYGPRQDPFGEAGVVSIFSSQMLNGGHPFINGSGEQQRDFVYVKDIAGAVVSALSRGSGETFNLGSGIPTSINTVFALLKEITGSHCEETHEPAIQGEVFRSYLSVDKAREGLGWQAQQPLRTGLLETVDSFRQTDG